MKLTKNKKASTLFKKKTHKAKKVENFTKLNNLKTSPSYKNRNGLKF